MREQGPQKKKTGRHRRKSKKIETVFATAIQLRTAKQESKKKKKENLTKTLDINKKKKCGPDHHQPPRFSPHIYIYDH